MLSSSYSMNSSPYIALAEEKAQPQDEKDLEEQSTQKATLSVMSLPQASFYQFQQPAGDSWYQYRSHAMTSPSHTLKSQPSSPNGSIQLSSFFDKMSAALSLARSYSTSSSSNSSCSIAEDREGECVAPSAVVTDALTDAEFNEHRLEIGLIPSESIVRQISANRVSSPRASGTAASVSASSSLSSSAAAASTPSVSSSSSSSSTSLSSSISTVPESAHQLFALALLRRYVHVPFIIIDHSMLPHSRLTPLFKRILTSNSLHLLSALLIGIHCILFYAALLGIYFLFFSPSSSSSTPSEPSLSPHAMWGFIVFFVLLILRSLLNVFLCAYRVRVPAMWINDATVSYYPADVRPIIHRLYHSCQHALQFWSMLIFLFITIITIITSLDTPPLHPVQILVIFLLGFEFMSIIAPLIAMAIITRFIPYRLLHWSLPYLPVTIPTPKEPSTGLSKEVIERLPVTIYDKASSSSSISSSSSSSSSHHDDDDEGLVCAICYAEVNDGETIRILPACHHQYHKTCIDPWLLRKASCPLCVRKVTAPIIEV